MAWTTTDLLTAIRREAFLPDAFDLSSADLLAIADEELATILAEIWKTSREERRVLTEDLPVVANVRRYRLPRRTLAGTVRGITFVDSSGSEGPADEVSPLEVWRWQQPAWSGGFRYFFEGDEIVLTTVPTASGGSLRVRYYERPPRLIEVTQANAIVEATSDLSIRFDGSPIIEITTPDALFDIVRGDSPFETIYRDRLSAGWDAVDEVLLDLSTPVDVAQISNRSGGAIHGARVDYICPRDTTVYPPIPQEMHPALVSAVLRRVGESQLDTAGAGLAEASMKRRIQSITNIAEPRNADRKPRLVSRGGALRGRGTWRGGWWG